MNMETATRALILTPIMRYCGYDSLSIMRDTIMTDMPIFVAQGEPYDQFLYIAVMVEGLVKEFEERKMSRNPAIFGAVLSFIGELDWISEEDRYTLKEYMLTGIIEDEVLAIIEWICDDQRSRNMAVAVMACIPSFISRPDSAQEEFEEFLVQELKDLEKSKPSTQ